MPSTPTTFRLAPALAASLALLAASARADDNYHAIADLLKSDGAKSVLKRNVELHWAGEPAPALARSSLASRYTRTALSLSPFGGSRRHCVEAFEKTLAAMVDDALQRGFDAIVDLRPVVDGKPLQSADGFSCKPGYKVTLVTLQGVFGMSETALRVADEREQRSLGVRPRPPAADALFMPIQAALDAPEARAVLGQIRAYAMSAAPSYRHRYGPEEYDGSAALAADGDREAACRQAVAKALADAVEAAREAGYTAIIQVRSRLNDDYAPQASDLECEVRKHKATVNLQVSMAADGI